MAYIPSKFCVAGSKGRLKQPTKRQLFEMLLMAIEFQKKRMVHVSPIEALSRKQYPEFVSVADYPAVYSVALNEIGFIDGIRYLTP